MWKLIFNEESGQGVATNRTAGVGEFMRELHPRDCAWFMSQPARYRWTGTGIEERPEWAQEEADREAAQSAAIAALEARVASIEAAKDASDLKQYTVEQGEQWITNVLTNAPNTYVGIKQAVGQILIRMLPYLLPKN